MRAAHKRPSSGARYVVVLQRRRSWSHARVHEVLGSERNAMQQTEDAALIQRVLGLLARRAA